MIISINVFEMKKEGHLNDVVLWWIRRFDILK